jgi:hypothetical protein
MDIQYIKFSEVAVFCKIPIVYTYVNVRIDAYLKNNVFDFQDSEMMDYMVDCIYVDQLYLVMGTHRFDSSQK